MKTKKYIFVLSCVSSIASLLLSIVFYHFVETNGWFDFLKDLFLGVFGGTVVSIVITLIEYFDCKRKNLEQLFDLFCKQRYEFNKIIYFNPKEKDNINCADLINTVIKSYQDVKYHHSIIGNIIVDTSFICYSKKKFEKLMSFYGNIQNVYNKFIEANFHFKNFQNGECPESIVINYIIDLQDEFFEISESVYDNEMRVINVFKIEIKEIDSALDYIGLLCYGKKYLNENKNLMEDNGYICNSYFQNIE